MNQQLAEVLQRHVAAENAHDLDATLATLHEDCLFEDCATGQVWHGRTAAADHYRQWSRCFDVIVKRDDHQAASWASDTRLISDGTWRGTHVGDFLGVPATGNAVTQPFVVVVAFKDGLIVGERFHYDLATLLRQLGRDRLPELTILDHRRVG